MRLPGKVALVTGAASGMGAATARRFGREGAAVIVADTLEEEGRAVAASIVAAKGNAVFIRLDVTSAADWESAIAETRRRFGKLDIEVNNAGISGSGVADSFDMAAWDQLMAVNATGVFLGMKFAVPVMKHNGGGSIVNISSISGNIGQTRLHLGYNASKGAVRIMSKSAAVQLGRDGIRVNTVHPGTMPRMRSSTGTPDEAALARRKHVPLGRSGEVDEVANAILFLASDEASYITGAELHVDGGYLAA
ncbi:MAG: SDR family NAD(P)-dependent oxidoreductase [Hyphomicrobiales bacterium]